MFTGKDIVLIEKPKIDKRGFWRPGSIRLGHQVNTLFCLIAAKRNKGRPKREKREIESERETERENNARKRERERERKTTDFGRAMATSLCIKSKDKVIRQH